MTPLRRKFARTAHLKKAQQPLCNVFGIAVMYLRGRCDACLAANDALLTQNDVFALIGQKLSFLTQSVKGYGGNLPSLTVSK